MHFGGLIAKKSQVLIANICGVFFFPFSTIGLMTYIWSDSFLKVSKANKQDLQVKFVCNRGDTVQYQGSLQSRELGQAPMLQVVLTPRQALSSHPRQQMA